MQRNAPFLPLLALAIPLGAARAQDGAPAPERPAAAAPAIAATLQTADLVLGTAALRMLDGPARLPLLQPDQHYVLTLTTDGKVRHATAAGNPGWLRVRAHPRALLELYAKQIDTGWETASGVLIMGLTQVGMTTKEAARLMKSVRAFPAQIDRVDLAISTNPRTQLAGLAITLAVRPAADTWFARLTRSLRPLPQGAPTLAPALALAAAPAPTPAATTAPAPGAKPTATPAPTPTATPAAKGPLMTMAFAIDPAGIQELLAPFVDMFGGMGARNKEQREAQIAMLHQALRSQDGSFYAVGDPFGGGTRTIGGLRDGAALAAILQDPDYARLARMAESMSSNIEVEYEPVSFEHRNVRVAKTVITTDIDTPIAPAGDQITYSAVAGAYMVSTTALPTGATKKLIDLALAGDVKRQPLPNGALAVMDLELIGFMDKIAPFNNPLAGNPDAPKHLRFTLDSKNHSLNLSVDFK